MEHKTIKTIINITIILLRMLGSIGGIVASCSSASRIKNLKNVLVSSPGYYPFPKLRPSAGGERYIVVVQSTG